MGYYLQTEHNHGKAADIIHKFQGKPVNKPKSFDAIPKGKALVCVVDNYGKFEAAIFVYSEQEFEAVTLPTDFRTKEWILIDWEVACMETGFKL